MNINFSNVNYIFSNNILSKNISMPAFRAQPHEDCFVKSTASVDKVDEKQAVRESLPEYLYHFTNQENYEKIIESGKINISKDIIDGVFLFDMNDFQTNWRNCSNRIGTQPLAAELMEQALKSKKGLVLLKIPTKNLDPMNFAIRPEDDVIKYIASDTFRNLHTAYAERGGIFNNKWELPKDLVEGYSPLQAEEFSKAKRPIEYVYKDSIDVDMNGVKKVFELPDIKYNSFWGYSKTEFNQLFDSLKDV